MKTKVVLGLFFGDEGKGLTVSNLTKKGDLVVRFNGGSQAGHTVEKNGYRHVFSSVGSGSLNGADTYWSEYCALYPKSLFNELSTLQSHGYTPLYYIHPLAPITTPFDIDHNRSVESVNKHGSVGMGFGATIARMESTPYKLHAIDLTYPELLEHKVRQIASYYKVEDPEEDIEQFLSYCKSILYMIDITTLEQVKDNYENIVFEGAQGIMLDMDHGFFPNVTRSNTTSKNAMRIIRENSLPTPEIFYCMRGYLTRHGNGWMPNEFTESRYEDDTNISHKYQGQFRQGSHSLDMIRFAKDCDSSFSYGCETNLVITCLNQTNGYVLVDNTFYLPNTIQGVANFHCLYTSYSKELIEKHGSKQLAQIS